MAVDVHQKNPTSGLKIPEAGSWTFKSPEVVAAFDRHVREQLPWYDLATGIVTHVARHYICEGGTVIDIGASTGNVGRAIGPILQARKASLVAIDNSADMVAAYDAPGEAELADAVEFDFAARAPDLVVAFLVLMFVPPAKRRGMINRMINAVRPGGAVLVFDKMAPAGGHVGAVLSRLTLAAKYEAGATAEEIIRKELSLAGVQRPITVDELPGFESVFQFGDFAGFLFEKPIA